MEIMVNEMGQMIAVIDVNNNKEAFDFPKEAMALGEKVREDYIIKTMIRKGAISRRSGMTARELFGEQAMRFIGVINNYNWFSGLDNKTYNIYKAKKTFNAKYVNVENDEDVRVLSEEKTIYWIMPR